MRKWKTQLEDKATSLGKYLNFVLYNKSLEVLEINKDLVQNSAEYVNYCTMTAQETRKENKARIIKKDSVESFLSKIEHRVVRPRIKLKLDRPLENNIAESWNHELKSYIKFKLLGPIDLTEKLTSLLVHQFNEMRRAVQCKCEYLVSSE